MSAISLCFLFIGILIVSVNNISYSAYTYIGNITSYTQDSSTVTFNCGTPKVKITVCSDDIVRVRMAQNGTFRAEEPWIVVKYNWPYVNYSFNDSGTYYQIETSKLIIRVNKSPLIISFYNKSNNLINKDHDTYRMAWDNAAVRCDKNMTSSEKFYGFGEYFDAPLNKRGKNLIMNVAQTQNNDNNSYLSSPFLISSNYYGIYFHNSWQNATFRMGTEASDRYSFEAPGGELDYYFIYGENSYKRVLELFTEIVGRTKLPPMWALGLACIKGGWVQTDFTNLASTWRSNNIPGDIIGLDSGWQNCQNSFTYFYRDGWSCMDDPNSMYNQMETMHFKNFIWIVPLMITDCNPTYTTCANNNYFVKRPDGVTDYQITNWTGTGCYLDFTKQVACDWYKTELKTDMRDHLNRQVPCPEGFKTDDVENLPADAVLSGGSGAELHNVLGFLHHKQCWTATEEVYGRGFSKSRSGSIGMHRYPIIWAGDQHPEWSELRQLIPAAICCGLAGFPLWANDLGGGGWGDQYAATDELFQRWTQFSMFTIMPLINNWSGPCRFPWCYSTTVKNVFNTYCKLHYRLIPYIYTYINEAHNKGYPLVRAMFLEFPSDSSTLDRDFDYMFGEWFLCAPVYTQGATTRSVYLPQGKWTDYWSETRYDGPQTINYSAPVDRLPLFVKGGAIIPMWPEMYYVTEKEPNPITLDIFPYGTSSFTLYEDDGRTSDYTTGSYATTTFDCIENTNSININIGARIGSYSGMPSTRYYRLQVHHVANTPVEVRRDSILMTKYNTLSELDTAVEGWYYDTSKKIVYIKPSQSASAPFSIAVNLIQAGTPTKLLLSAFPTTLSADGTSTSTITAGVYDANNILVTDSNALITFSLSGAAGGTLIGTNPVNANGGIAKITYRSGSSSGTITITGTSSGLTQGQTTISLTKTGQATKLILSASPSSITANGTSTSTITAGVYDSNNNLVPNSTALITFSLSGAAGGTLIGTNPVNANGGIAQIIYRSGTSTGTVTVTGTSSGLTQGETTITLVLNDPPNPPLNLKCVGQTNPKSVTDFTPDFMWTFSDPNPGNTQSAYRLLVSSNLTEINSNIGRMWDTNKVNSTSNIVIYNGKQLQYNSTYYWKVQTWDNFDLAGQFSTVATFTMTEIILAVSTSVLDFGLIGPQQTYSSGFTVSNIGSGTLIGTISTDQDWIIVDPPVITGLGPGQSVVISVTVDNNVLQQIEGEYTGIINIDSNGGSAIVNVIVQATCVLVKPNPYNPNKGLLTFFGSGIVPGKTTIKIYTLSGELVKTINSISSLPSHAMSKGKSGTISSLIEENKSENEILWNGTNENGDYVVSGIYLYLYESPKEKGIGKFTIIK